ncbi:MAG: ATP-binding protein [Sporomusaceae bacterium]|nr:ATP-binding protein [Sporomusaceae bacterium]
MIKAAMRNIWGLTPPLLRSISGGIALLGLFLITLLWLIVFGKLGQEKEHAIQSGKENAANFAQIYEENALRTIKSADQFALFLKYQYERDGRQVDMSPYYSNGPFQVEPYILLSLADERGNLIASNQRPFVFSNIDDREHFLIHKDPDAPQPFVSQPVLGRSSGKWSIQVTRRLNKSSGDFAGAVIVSLDPFYFTNYYNRVHLGEGASVALIGMDGIIRAWQSNHQALIGMNVKNSKVMELAASSPEGQYIATSTVDGVKRIYAYRTLPDYSLLLIVGLSEQEVLAEFYEQQRTYFLMASLLSFLIFLFCSLLIAMQSVRQRGDKVRLALYKISDLGNRSENLIDFYAELDQIMVDLMGTKYFYIALYNEKSQVITHLGKVGAAIDKTLKGRDQGLVRFVLEQGESLSLGAEQCRQFLQARSGGEAVPTQWFGSPLKAGDQSVFGIMAVYSFKKTFTFWQERRNEAIFDLLANQVAITIEKQRAAAALRKLSSVVEQSPVAVVITDTKGAIEYVNPDFSLLTGYEADEVLGENPRLLKSAVSDKELFMALWESLQQGRIWQGEICNKKKDGSLYWARMVISPVRNAAGTITHFVGIQDDITRQKELETVLLQAKEAAEAASKAKSTFLASMSHEIRTPMNAILGFVQLLEHDETLSNQQRQYLATISRSGRHLLAIINDVLEMSKIESGRIMLKPEIFNLAELIRAAEEVLRLKAESKGLSFVVTYPETAETAFVAADVGKLRQVLINLLDNAIKFTKVGEVKLSVKLETAAQDFLRVFFAVADSGPGITPLEQEQLFQSFEQTQAGREAGGTGLGLAISREYVRKMGGDITIDSEVGRGSTFSFNLLLKLEAADIKVQSENKGIVIALAPDQPKYRILIVDDVDSNRLLLKQMLEGVGFVTKAAGDGEEAVTLFSQWAPDLILMDIVMPRMDGYEAIRQIRSQKDGKTIPILAVTASVFEEERQKMIAADASDCLRKPIHRGELFDKIAKLLPVHYLYQDESIAAEKHEESLAEAAIYESLARLDSSLRQKLERATIEGDYYLLLELINEIQTSEAALAKSLKSLVQQFEFQRLLDILTGKGA